jgi:D-alanyl-D-alanine carboxypeptidase (penicillin-binding protein 5/6)
MRRILLCPLLLVLASSASFAAQSWIIVDNDTGHILASGNPNAKRQVASLTKIATAMVVLDWAEATGTSMASAVEVPPGVTGVGGVNPCGLQPGDRASLRDLVSAAMMSSDNHAAYTLAHNVGSRLPNPQRLAPVENFTAHMNALARKLGMKRTLFLNPHGLDNMTPPPHSTAADIARLTRYAYSHGGFNFYASQPVREVTIEGADGFPRSFQMRNTNELLGQDGIEGVKTGRTGRAGDCLVLAASREPLAVTNPQGQKVALPRRLIVVLLGSPDRFGEGMGMIRQGWDLHQRWQAQGRPVGKRTTL